MLVPDESFSTLPFRLTAGQFVAGDVAVDRHPIYAKLASESRLSLSVSRAAHPLRYYDE
jgi:hypothetical protein